MSATGDLWPYLELPDMPTPLSILREQAGYLAKKTQGLVEGRVDRHTWEELGKTTTYVRFLLVAPALGGYEYTLLTLTQDPVILYPVQDADAGVTMKDEDELRKHLRHVFSLPETLAVIQSLVSQSREGSE